MKRSSPDFSRYPSAGFGKDGAALLPPMLLSNLYAPPFQTRQRALFLHPSLGSNVARRRTGKERGNPHRAVSFRQPHHDAVGIHKQVIRIDRDLLAHGTHDE